MVLWLRFLSTAVLMVFYQRPAAKESLRFPQQEKNHTPKLNLTKGTRCFLGQKQEACPKRF